LTPGRGVVEHSSSRAREEEEEATGKEGAARAKSTPEGGAEASYLERSREEKKDQRGSGSGGGCRYALLKSKGGVE
jgi:hypothetical protein